MDYSNQELESDIREPRNRIVSDDIFRPGSDTDFGADPALTRPRYSGDRPISYNFLLAVVKWPVETHRFIVRVVV